MTGTQFQPGYPKRIVVQCVCHEKRPFFKYLAVPAQTLCKRCQAWQKWFDRQYADLISGRENSPATQEAKAHDSDENNGCEVQSLHTDARPDLHIPIRPGSRLDGESVQQSLFPE